ncbi:hypothetical protein [Actibacterium ureilyticum]|uniref:hypothetical protein n=1 Tax=Actibacterium ureilyticum TaxID=1590614 RepID=UPI000BAAAC40|nr:hypothetical protein [Actibacterium ureilyticum]
MRSFVKQFFESESGAVTVDWVVLTAAVVGMAVGVILLFNSGPQNVASKISDSVAGIGIDTGNE